MFEDCHGCPEMLASLRKKLQQRDEESSEALAGLWDDIRCFTVIQQAWLGFLWLLWPSSTSIETGNTIALIASGDACRIFDLPEGSVCGLALFAADVADRPSYTRFPGVEAEEEPLVAFLLGGAVFQLHFADLGWLGKSFDSRGRPLLVTMAGFKVKRERQGLRIMALSDWTVV